jgi:hypothetical protein
MCSKESDFQVIFRGMQIWQENTSAMLAGKQTLKSQHPEGNFDKI